MQGIVFRGERELELVTLPDPAPGPEDVVIEVKASGMCGTDLHRYRGDKQSAHTEIGGHEPAGIVVAAGSQVPPAWLGRSVMVHHYIGCARCDQCRAGWTQLCRHGAAALGNTVHGSH